MAEEYFENAAAAAETEKEEAGFIGEVQIADEVVQTIAALATSEVDGVIIPAGMFGGKNLSKAVRVIVKDEMVTVDVVFEAKYGYSIPKITKDVQDKVVQAIESMTGLHVSEVNVRITGVKLPNTGSAD